jgi:hypothetical protein
VGSRAAVEFLGKVGKSKTFLKPRSPQQLIQRIVEESDKQDAMDKLKEVSNIPLHL